MKQKIIKIGSSLGITIPKKSLPDLGFKVGDTVNIDIDSKKSVWLLNLRLQTIKNFMTGLTNLLRDIAMHLKLYQINNTL